MQSKLCLGWLKILNKITLPLCLISFLVTPRFFGGALRPKRARKAFNDMAYPGALKDMNPRNSLTSPKLTPSTPGTEYYIDLQGREVTAARYCYVVSRRGQLGAFNALPGEVIDIESAFRSTLPVLVTRAWLLCIKATQKH